MEDERIDDDDIQNQNNEIDDAVACTILLVVTLGGCFNERSHG
jgi:hypothetical protein